MHDIAAQHNHATVGNHTFLELVIRGTLDFRGAEFYELVVLQIAIGHAVSIVSRCRLRQSAAPAHLQVQGFRHWLQKL